MRSFSIMTALAALAVGCAAPMVTGPQELANVEFTSESLEPETATITQTGNVRWLNQGEEMTGVVVLPADIASSLACGDQMEPMFRRVEPGFASLPIDDFEARDVRLPCALAPGTYRYEIWIFGEGLGRVVAEPQNKLAGTIVVE